MSYAHIMVESGSHLFHGSGPDVTPHPDNGHRQDRDEMVNLVELFFIPLNAAVALSKASSSSLLQIIFLFGHWLHGVKGSLPLNFLFPAKNPHMSEWLRDLNRSQPCSRQSPQRSILC